jgi:hypothetical protein
MYWDGVNKVMDSARQLVESHLGFTLPDETWSFLERYGFVSDYRVAKKPVAWLADRAREVLEAAGTRTPRTEIEPMLPRAKRSRRFGAADRVEALSSIFANDARRDSAVIAFRRDHLSGGCLALNEVESWILQHAATPHTRWITVPLDDSDQFRFEGNSILFEPKLSISRLAGGFSLSTETLAYTGQTATAGHIPVRLGTVLDELRGLSTYLAQRYGWQEAQATSFVLTDAVPVVSLARLSTKTNFQLTALTRITLTVDPTLSPRKVTEIYAKARRDLLGPRHRSLTAKHLKLAQFTAEAADDEPWKARMERWNRIYPEMRYSSPSNFGRDCRQAFQRLLHPRINFAGLLMAS